MRELRRALTMIVAAGLVGSVTLCRAENDCGDRKEASTYKAAPGDIADSTHLSASRRFSGTGTFAINLNKGELHIEHSSESDQLRVRITSAKPDSTLAKALRKFDATASDAALDICAASDDQVTVTVFLPTATTLKSEINLGAGTLILRADGVQGNRQINVGAGQMKIYLVGDRDYGSLQANVGFGRFLDHRAKGHSSYGVTSKSMTGSGAGSLELNLGAGTLALESGGA